MLQWPPEWPHPLVLQQEQATHFMQWKRAARGRPITEYQRGTTEGEYMVWKQTLDNVVESTWARHHQAAHDRQEAAAARARQEAARRQQLLDELKEDGLLYATCLFAQCVAKDHGAGLLFAKRLFARCVTKDQWSAKHRAQARERAAACTIFLWLCRRRRLHIRLARQTLRRQQREAALACLQYKQDCCLCAALAEEQRQQAAAAQEKALADEADRRRRQDALAKEQHHHKAACALQEAAAARAHQEAARVSNAIACARQEGARCQQLLAKQAA
jgi:hypothetical protein